MSGYFQPPLYTSIHITKEGADLFWHADFFEKFRKETAIEGVKELLVVQEDRRDAPLLKSGFLWQVANPRPTQGILAQAVHQLPLGGSIAETLA